MGLQELLETLKKNERKQIEEIWQAAQNEAESLRKQVNEEIAAISKKHEEQLAFACQKSRHSIFSDAEIETRSKKLFVYQALDQALHAAAVKQLGLLRDQQYAEIFETLVHELPDRQWEKVRVNPVDCDLAAGFFPKNIIQADAAVSGGLIVTAAEGRIIVDNTFEKRLKRLWFRILPLLIEHIETQYAETKPAANI